MMTIEQAELIRREEMKKNKDREQEKVTRSIQYLLFLLSLFIYCFFFLIVGTLNIQLNKS
jgi:hypothetical protein